MYQALCCSLDTNKILPAQRSLRLRWEDTAVTRSTQVHTLRDDTPRKAVKPPYAWWKARRIMLTESFYRKGDIRAVCRNGKELR